VGAVAGAATLAASEAVARARQRPGEIPALPHRILMSGALAAPPGWVAGAAGAGLVAVGTAAGTIAGLMGLRPPKVVMGPIVGLGVGTAALRVRPGTATSSVAAASVVAYRTLSALLFRDAR
jgi:hypothetical protein